MYIEKLKKLKKLKSQNYKTYNNSDHLHMLEKGMAQYYKCKWISNSRKYKFYLISGIVTLTLMNMVKWYYVVYYYIMWDIDIRKPRVSDYIVERFR